MLRRSDGEWRLAGDRKSGLCGGYGDMLIVAVVGTFVMVEKARPKSEVAEVLTLCAAVCLLFEVRGVLCTSSLWVRSSRNFRGGCCSSNLFSRNLSAFL